ncbi:pro-FMRFamide-related neuropeptide VF [Osmerus eperlanus]|uniref:pro-FMRFamide-related neuropeptide VF n=1 Tax=Osmerus eperlanus TaxID=29151 RepID=UPI002E0D2E5B
MCPTATLMVMLIFGMLGFFVEGTTSEIGRYEKSISNDNRNYFRKRQYIQSSNEIPRSLEIQDFKINILPTSGKVNLPTMVKLFSGSTKPLHLHANLPLRFGRESDLGDRLPKSTLNLPQRFGRSGTEIQSCSECPHLGVVPSATLPQRFGRNSPFRNLFRTKGHARIIKAVPGPKTVN